MGDNNYPTSAHATFPPGFSVPEESGVDWLKRSGSVSDELTQGSTGVSVFQLDRLTLRGHEFPLTESGISHAIRGMNTVISPVQYETPWVVDDPAQCAFYHEMDLPGHGRVRGDWDLRDCIGPYLGNYNFKGKRVLDVGAASGFLTFSMESQGAEVVSFDMKAAEQWDIVPQRRYRENPNACIEDLVGKMRRLKNGYWFSHARLLSQAKVYYGDVYHIPEALGVFDVAVFGMIITHLRDAFRALYSAARLVKESLIITNQTPGGTANWAHFVPTVENQQILTWWVFTEACIRQMVSIFGFEVIATVESLPQCLVHGRKGPESCTAFVCKRVEPM